MTGNAQPEQPFGGTARPQTWVMRSLSPWISRMASGPASRASSPAISARNTIGTQVSQQAHWISRRAERIERAAAWNGELGAVSPALVDRFSQRVANRVQRSTRSHQVDAYSGGDNLESRLDMPLVSNEGALTPLSDGSAGDTPFEFGAFSPEHVQRKPAAPQPEAPAAPPPMSNALRERAEQLRRSLATNTPAPAINPSPIAPAIQPSRNAPSPQSPQPPAPRVMRAKPATRIEEIGPGKAPRPAPATPPVPEPPRPAQTQVQRAPQPPASQPSSKPATPNVQRTALPPQVVQGQGKLTQMLNARFRPKLDEARNPDAPRAAASDGDDFNDDAGISDAPAQNISRSVAPSTSDDLTPRAPVRRLSAEDASATQADAPAQLPIPTPKPRVLRKPALPVTAPPKPTTPAATGAISSASQPPAVQRKPDAPSSPQMPTTATPATLTDGEISTPSVVAVQRTTVDDASPAIQRETTEMTAQDVDLPLVAPAQSPAPNIDVDGAMQSSSEAPAVQREMRDESPAAKEITATPPIVPTTTEAIQRSATPAMPPSQRADAPAQPMKDAPLDLTLRAPQSVPADDAPQSEIVQRSVVGDAPAMPETRTSAPAQSQRESSIPQEAPSTIQRMALNVPLVETSVVDAASSDVALLLVQRAPATPDDDDDANAAPFENPTTPALAAQRMAVNVPPAEVSDVDVSSSDVAMPLVQRAPATPDDDDDANAAPSENTTASSPAVQRMAVNAPPAKTPDADVVSSVADLPLAQRTPAVADESEDASATPPEIPTGQAPAVQPMAVNAPPAKTSDADVVSSVVDFPLAQRAPATMPEVVSAEMPLQTPAARESDALVVHRPPSVVAAGAPVVHRQPSIVAPQSLQRAVGVALADMPVLRAASREAGEADVAEARAISMPIVQRATVKHQQQIQREAQVRPANPYVAEQARTEAMPVVHRSPANDAPEVRRAEVDEPVAVTATKNAIEAPAKNRAVSEAELALAAQRLLPIIKRLLAVERERLFGR